MSLVALGRGPVGAIVAAAADHPFGVSDVRVVCECVCVCVCVCVYVCVCVREEG